MSLPPIVVSESDVSAVASAIADAGVFAFDLEFLSADRYIPELCLLQVAWPGAEPVAIDPLEVSVEPVLELIASEEVVTLAHSAKQDLQLLFERHDCRARRFFDTQIAAAFCGLGDQMGLSRLVEALCRVKLDKGSQFTNWKKRPLSKSQVRYALDDVRYLLPIWDDLEAQLRELQRLAWVDTESMVLAEQCATATPPEEIYRRVSGGGALKGKSLAALRGVAAWRERQAREENKPPSWLIPDKAMVEAARRSIKSAGDLKRLKGVGPGIVRNYGDEILRALSKGAGEGAPDTFAKEPLTTEGQAMAAVLNSAVQAECRRNSLAPRFVGARADVEELVRWFLAGADDATAEELKLLSSWRRTLVGDDALAWLRGDRAVVADADEGVRLVPLGS